MRTFIIAAISAACTTISPAIAQERNMLGNGSLFTNDYIGDGNDRWRSGSYVFSHVRGRKDYDGTLGAFGDILEYRFRSEIIASRAGVGDGGIRPYVGLLSLGLHTHYAIGDMDASFGVDVAAIGPQTGLDDFQNRFHDTFGLADAAQNSPLADDIFFSATAEISQTFVLGNNVTLRPFAELQTGTEEIVRVGGDLMIGSVGQSDLKLRDVVTGQLYRGTNTGETGVSYVVGADIAAVGGSLYLPADQGYVPTDTRTRARAGVHYQANEKVGFFYGMTYLSEEYVGQPEGQVVGSLELNINF